MARGAAYSSVAPHLQDVPDFSTFTLSRGLARGLCEEEKGFLKDSECEEWEKQSMFLPANRLTLPTQFLTVSHAFLAPHRGAFVRWEF